MKHELKIASKDYKKAVAKAKAIAKKEKVKKLKNSKTKNPKFYWSVLNGKNNHKIKNSIDKPNLDTFFMVLRDWLGTKTIQTLSMI